MILFGATPIGRLFNKLFDFVSSSLGNFFDMLQHMNMIHLGIVSAVVLAIAAFCLKGSPIRST
jgi:hypothetical protein